MELQMWREIINPYELAVDELVLKFEHIITSLRQNNQYSPIEQVYGRVKTISSIIEKVQQKGISFEEIEKHIDDMAGIRIICQFVEDIEKVLNIIRNRKDMIILEEKDFIKNRKQSGYRSYHIIIAYQVETIAGAKKLKTEIQIRTLAMNFWATIDHSLQYKYKGNMPKHLTKTLLNAAEVTEALDREMSGVHKEIVAAQNIFQYKANIVFDILNNIQNLYKVANKREVIKIQDNFYKIYAEDDTDKLLEFSRELDHISESYRVQSLI